jgi:glyoxylase-like metal-dependent hydrolase (beta-lactamase superfamily II)
MLCRIGEIEIWRILEINGPFMAPEALFPNGGPNMRAIIEARVPGQLCVQTRHLILPIQGFLLKTPEHVILVDACVGNDKTNTGRADWHQRSGTRFKAALSAAGVGPQDVDYVLCTHLHVDHVGWNTRLEDGRLVPTFANARYLISAADEAEYSAQPTDSFSESVLPVIEAGQAEMVQPGHMLGDHITLFPTPGHTPGHVSIRLKSGSAEAVITGDALHSAVQCWHPEWHFKYDADPERAESSRRSILTMAAETGCTVLGSHFRLPSIGRVRGDAGGFRWEDS